jgi:hypothetical protein
MPNEPNQAMENELKAYAERRRREAPAQFELDEPARRALQTEVRRVYVERPEPESSRVSWWVWMRVGLAATAAVVVLIVSVTLIPREQPGLLTKSTETLVAREPATADSAADHGGIAPAEPTGGEPFGVPLNEPTAMAPVSRPDSRDGQPTAVTPAGDRLARSSAPVAAREVTFAATPAMAESDRFAGTGGREFLQVQRYRLNPNSPPPPQVLQNFRWLRNGDAVQVIDADGSVYTGQVGPAVPAQERRAMSVSAEGAVLTRDEPVRLRSIAGQTGERFVVSGTNQTLKVRVEFEGFIVPPSMTVGTIAASSKAAGVGGAALQIQGQAVVGSSTRLEIVAEPRGE